MSLPKAKYREIVFQVLFSEEEGGTQSEDLVAFMMKELEVGRRSVRSAWERAKLIQEKKEIIDALIASYSVDYRLPRIPSVERNTLRLGIYELIYDDEVPAKVAISEAIRLTRKFASPEAAQFVNAILDQIYKSREPAEE